MYYAAVLTKESRDLLLKKFKPLVPSFHKICCDHCTIAYNPKPNNFIVDFCEKNLGSKIKAEITEIAIDYNKAIAFGVTNIISLNEEPHITLSVAEGHKPVESNNLDWDNTIQIEPIEIDVIINKLN